jgi:predicted PurR-regulated permease PerM
MDLITSQLLRRAVPLLTALASVLLLLAIAALLTLGKDVFIPLALATLLSFALAPLVLRFQRVGLGRGLSVVGAVLLALFAFGAIGYVVASQLADLAADLPSYRSTIQRKIDVIKQTTASGDTFERAGAVLKDIIADLGSIGRAEPIAAAPTTIVALRTEEVGTLAVIGLYASPLLKPLATTAIVFLFAIFMLAQREDLRNRFIRLAGTNDLQQTTAALDDAGLRLGKLLLTQLSLNAAFGLVIGLGLWAIGLPSPFLWGVIAGLMRFVPYIGAVVGVALPLAVAFAVDPGWSTLLWTIALFVVVEPVVAHVIEPLLVGRNTGVSPIAILVSATLWTFLWGPIGLVLATPLTICLIVIGRHIPRLQFIDIMLGDKPALAPPEIFYQRMLAGDPTEATQQAKEFLKERSLSTYYDEIALEAIRLAHRDIVRGVVAGGRLDRMVRSSDELVGALSSMVGPAPRGGVASVEAAAAIEAIRPDHAVARRVVGREELAPQWRVDCPIVVVAGGHPLDAPVASMLAQLFGKHGLTAKVVSVEDAMHASAGGGGKAALVCFSFIEPLSTLHLRLASIETHRRLPSAQVMLCIWQQRDPRLIAGLTKRLRVDAVATTMTDALTEAVRMSAPPGRAQISGIGRSEMEILT